MIYNFVIDTYKGGLCGSISKFIQTIHVLYIKNVYNNPYS
jgi:hypothetical protein